MSRDVSRPAIERMHAVIAPYAQGILWDAFRLVVEPGGAAALAALIAGRYRPSRDEHVAVVLCGGNARRHGPH